MNTIGQGNWIDKLFQKKLSNFEISTETHIWEIIAKKLDQNKRRPGFFGNWWAVLLSILTLLLIGIGAYMIFKKYDAIKSDKKQNRDLPFMPIETKEDGTAFLEFAELRTIRFTPKVSEKKDIESENSIQQTKFKGNLSSNKKAETSINNPLNPIDISLSSVNFTKQENQSLINLSDIINTPYDEDLIVSSDSEFISAKDLKSKTFSALPLKEIFLKKEDQKEKLSSLVLEGCNVYRDDRTHFFVDVYYAPEIASRTLKTTDPALQTYVDDRSNSEKPIISYSTGVKASIVLSNGLTVRGGVSFSSNTERFDFVKETQTIKKEIFNNEGHLVRTEYTELVIMDKSYNKYKYVDVPIMLGYEKDLKDFVLSLNGGIGINVSSSQSGKIYKDNKNKMTFYTLEENGEENKPIFRKNAGLSLIGSVGLNYKYNERIMLLLEPSARYYVRSLSDPINPVSQNYLYLGLNIGLRYRIK